MTELVEIPAPTGRKAPPPHVGPMPENSAIASSLREYADILEHQGEHGFRVSAYRKAADVAAGLGVHDLGRTRDWVVIYYHTDATPEGQCTVVTETRWR